MGVTIVTSAGNINVTTARDVLSAAPIGWDEQIAQYGRGGALPIHEGSSAVFRVGDSKSIEDTIIGLLRAANSLKVINAIDPDNWFKLLNTNSFGNLFRFTSDIGGYENGGVWYDSDGVVSSEGVEFANDWVIDNYTHIMWYRILGSGIWDANIDDAISITIGVYSDIFMANTKQLLTLSSKEFGMNYEPFSHNATGNIMSSTTREDVTTQTFVVEKSILGRIITFNKTGADEYFRCRIFQP